MRENLEVVRAGEELEDQVEGCHVDYGTGQQAYNGDDACGQSAVGLGRPGGWKRQ